MRFERIMIAALAVVMMSVNGFSQKRVSILGDSYSTYGGAVQPEWNLTWYNCGVPRNNDVKAVEETWWRLLTDEDGYVLDRNNSFSGSTISCTGYFGADYSDRAFISRVFDLGKPDIILVFGGTNDSWAGVPMGRYQYTGWTKPDMYDFRPAFAYLIHSLKETYPLARICNIVNSELSDEITESMSEICRYYDVDNVMLHDIDKQEGHPSVAGMQAIAEQVRQTLMQDRR